MRVLLVNTSELTGGAAIAANRLMNALNCYGLKAKIMVLHKETNNPAVVPVGSGWRKRLTFLWERFVIFVHYGFRRDGLFDIDSAAYGFDITRTREFKEADVVHLHWINQGFISLRTIRRILASGKPIVWTLHDIWPATAICHVAAGCTRYKNGQCRRCPLLGGRSDNDFANKVWRQKLAAYREGNIVFVGCSRWITNQAKQSKLLDGMQVVNIPNTIDTHWYTRHNEGCSLREWKQQSKERAGFPQKKVILFVSQRITQLRKGIQYLIDALQLLCERDPSFSERHCVAILGGSSEEMATQMPIEALPLGYVSNNDRRIVDIYNAADVFVTPSLEDNLPNTVMEAMACALPCVGFNVGGIPEMIDHQKNGYVAEFRNTEDLAQGIDYVLNHPDYQSLSDNAISKVHHSYSAQTVAMHYSEVYQHALTLTLIGKI